MVLTKKTKENVHAPPCLLILELIKPLDEVTNLV